MNIYTEDEALRELLEFGKTKDKRYCKLPKEAIRGLCYCYRDKLDKNITSL